MWVLHTLGTHRRTRDSEDIERSAAHDAQLDVAAATAASM
jgi:hypothetical protein